MCSTPTSTAWWAIQGAEVVDAEARGQLSRMPAHETVVLVPRDLLMEYVRNVQAESGS